MVAVIIALGGVDGRPVLVRLFAYFAVVGSKCFFKQILKRFIISLAFLGIELSGVAVASARHGRLNRLSLELQLVV